MYWYSFNFMSTPKSPRLGQKRIGAHLACTGPPCRGWLPTGAAISTTVASELSCPRSLDTGRAATCLLLSPSSSSAASPSSQLYCYLAPSFITIIITIIIALLTAKSPACQRVCCCHQNQRSPQTGPRSRSQHPFPIQANPPLVTYSGTCAIS